MLGHLPCWGEPTRLLNCLAPKWWEAPHLWCLFYPSQLIKMNSDIRDTVSRLCRTWQPIYSGLWVTKIGSGFESLGQCHDVMRPFTEPEKKRGGRIILRNKAWFLFQINGLWNSRCRSFQQTELRVLWLQDWIQVLLCNRLPRYATTGLSCLDKIIQVPCATDEEVLCSVREG